MDEPSQPVALYRFLFARFGFRKKGGCLTGSFAWLLKLSQQRSQRSFSCRGNGILGPFLHGISTKRDSKCDEAAYKSRGHELLVQSSRTRIEFEGQPHWICHGCYFLSVRLGRSLQWPVYHPWSCYWLAWVETRHLVASIFQMGSFCKGLEPHGQQHFRVCIDEMFSNQLSGWDTCSLRARALLLPSSASQLWRFYFWLHRRPKKLQKVLEFWDGERKFHRISLLYHIIKSSSEYLQRLALLHLKLRMDSMPEFWSRSYSQRRSPLPMDHPWSMCHGAKSFVWGRWVDVDQDDGFEFRKTLQTSWVKYSMTGIFMMWLPPKVFFCPIKRQFGWMNDPKLRYLVWLNVMIHPEWRF